MKKNILNKVSTLAVVLSVAGLVILSNPLSNNDLNKASASGYGSTNSNSALNINSDCRVNGTCSSTNSNTTTTNTETEIKKEEPKKEVTNTEVKEEIPLVGKPEEKEINGKKYYITNGSNILVTRVLKDTSDYKTKFTDIENSSVKDDIIKLEMSAVVKGTTPTTFEPNRAITRAEYLAVIMGAYGYDLTKPASNLPFSDVKVAWQQRVISVALENKIISGDTDRSGNRVFRPNDQISKIEAYAILSNISGIYFSETFEVKHSFVDAAATWQNEVLAEAEYLELTKVPTDKKFNPNSGISREDMANLIVKYAKLY